MMDGINFFLIGMLYFIVFVMDTELNKLWYFHKHNNREEGKRFREYIGKKKPTDPTTKILRSSK